MTNGASEAIDATLCIEPGDKLLMQNHCCRLHTTHEVLGGKPIYIDTTATQFKITPDALESHISPKTKAVLLNYPTNPTGVVLKRNEVLNIVNVLKKYPIFIISNKIYAENTF
ncbi:aminotransferase class I/II-fold pyridoxal phosphate-dependent enzyme [Staphylococcus aureus]